MNVLVKNIGQLATYNPRAGRVEKYDHASLEILDGKVAGIFSGESTPFSGEYENVVDAKGRLVSPGFVDPHTHPVYAQTREDEFAMRIRGMSYQEIAEQGGGIRNSVRRLREMPEDDLKRQVVQRLLKFIAYGTTTVEAKSGYGLDTENELKSLRAVKYARDNLPMEIVPTFMGAHEIPDEYRDDKTGYVQLLCEEMIPAVSDANLAEYCDAFCEAGVFTAGETEEILRTALDNGMKLRLHADEFEAIGGVEVAASLGAHSVDHLMAVTESGMQAIDDSDMVPTVLPGTTFFLGHDRYAPAREMWDRGLPVALATDYNPGSSMTYSMQMILNLACIKLRLTPDEALQAATYHAAGAIAREDHKGCLSPDYDADFIIWETGTWDQVPYEYGTNKVLSTFIGGEQVWTRDQ